MRPGGVVALFVLLSTLAVPISAQAAESRVDLRIDPPPLVPPAGSVQHPVKVIYQYSGSGSSDGSVEVDLTVDPTDPFDAGLQPDPLKIQVDDDRKRGTGWFNLTLLATPDAEAFATSDVRLTAKARRSGTVEPSRRVEATIRPQVAFLPDLRLAPVPDTHELSSSRITTVDVVAVNRGNGPVRIQMELVEKPEGVSAALPQPKVVSHERGSNRDEIPVRLFTTSDELQDTETVRLRAQYGYHRNSSLGHTTNIVEIQVRPGSGGSLVLPVAGGFAVVVVALFAVWWVKFR